MQKTTRYVIILILSILAPILYYFTPVLIGISRSGDVENGNTMAKMLEPLFENPDRFSSMMKYAEGGEAIVYLMSLFFILGFLLLIIFAAARSRGGVMTMSILGMIANSLVIFALIAMIAEYGSSYYTFIPGIGIIAALGLQITTLAMAGADKEKTYAPDTAYPIYGGYSPYSGGSSYSPSGSAYDSAPYGAAPAGDLSETASSYSTGSTYGSYGAPSANETSAPKINYDSSSEDLESNWTEF